MAPVGIHDIAPKRNHKRTEGQERRMIIGIDNDKLKFVADSNGKLVVTLENLTDAIVKKELLQNCVITRCKDCKHWLPHTQFGYDADYEEYHNYCKRHLPDDDFYAFRKEADDFCSWAERKEE